MPRPWPCVGQHPCRSGWVCQTSSNCRGLCAELGIEAAPVHVQLFSTMVDCGVSLLRGVEHAAGSPGSAQGRRYVWLISPCLHRCLAAVSQLFVPLHAL
jgi:hypothetical protein